MASMSRLARTIQLSRTIASCKSLAPPSPRHPLYFMHRSFNHHIHTNVSAVLGGVGAVLVLGLLSSLKGTAAIFVDYSETRLPIESPWTYVDLEATAKNERVKLEEVLKSKGMQYGSYPRFTVDVKGQKVIIKFPLPLTRDHVIKTIVSRLHKPWSEMHSGLTFGHPKMQKEPDAELCILIVCHIGLIKREVQFIKQGNFTTEELELLADVLQFAGPN